MPKKPLQPCGYPGCPELTEGRYCDKHRRRVNNAYNRYTRDEDSKKFYASAAWAAASRRQLTREPLCAECLRAGRAVPAEIADHIIPIREGGARLDTANLQSLCRACHNRKHA